MEFTLLELVRAFLFSLLLGVFAAVLYEPIRLLHMLGLNSSKWYLFFDTLFMIICAFLTFFYSLIMLEGSVRFFVIFGEGIGFLAFYFTLRPLLNRIYAPLIKIFKFFVEKKQGNCLWKKKRKYSPAKKTRQI